MTPSKRKQDSKQSPLPAKKQKAADTTLDSFLKPGSSSTRKQHQQHGPGNVVEIADSSDEDDEVQIVESTSPSTSKAPLKAAAPTPTPMATGGSSPVKGSPSRSLNFFGAPAKAKEEGEAIESSPSLAESIYAFDPSKVSTTAWPKGRMPYAMLVDAFVKVDGTRSRLEIVKVLTNLLRVVIEKDPESLLQVIYLTTNRLAPSHTPDLELGIGTQVLTKSLTTVSGLSSAGLRSLWAKHGDAGDVAFHALASVRLLVQPPELTCHGVFSTLLSLAKMKGQGSQSTKTEKVKGLLVAARGEERRYLVRTLVQHLRIGAVRLTLTQALARAFCLTRSAQSPPVVDDAAEYWITEEERGALLSLEGKKPSQKGKEKEDPVVKSGRDKMATAESLVRGVWARHPDYGAIVDALLSKGLAELYNTVGLSLGTPIQPMLGSITRSLSSIYTRFGSRPFVSEAKLDGQRAQIHVSLECPEGDQGYGRWVEPASKDGKRIWVRLFSRHLEDMTPKYPDLLDTLALIVDRSCSTETPLSSFIIDAEVAAISPTTGELRPFQELSYRSKKDVELGNVKIRVGCFAFDLMLLNGDSLLSQPFRERRRLLRSLFAPLGPEDPRLAKWELIPCEESNDPDAVKAFFDESLKMKAEGIMVKLLDEVPLDEDGEPIELDGEDDADGGEETKKRGRKSKKTLPASYEPDKRADSWQKVKKDYLDDLGDSLDLVPIGAWHGMGRKKDWWSPILLGTYDEDAGGWVAVCKCMSGFSDAFYKSLHERYAPGSATTSNKPFPMVNAAGIRPNIWFQPREVWEVRGADFTLSPVYPAAQGLVSERGISVRFPRFMKVREDKDIEDATSVEQLADLYRKQGHDAREDGDGADDNE